jgi:ubiquinone/menaquinone biosynthesis C-methylase UbiE
MTLYNSIGKTYNATRQADPRIVAQLTSLLNLPKGSTIADIGAGTGNYSRAIADQGYQVIAIEPSEVMQSQGAVPRMHSRACKPRQQQPQPHVSWLTAKAEQIPLADNTVDGSMVMLALHHFVDLQAGLREISRITKSGKIVIFAFEQNLIGDFWLSDYFPYFIQDTRTTFPSTQDIAHLIAQVTQKEPAIIPFLLPADLKDLFAASGWCRPEIYLDEQVRGGISTFAKMPTNQLEAGLKRLQEDLADGIWQQKYGHLLHLSEYDAGYRILATS